MKIVEGSFYVSFSKKVVRPGASQNGLQSTILLLPGLCANVESKSKGRRCKVSFSSVSAAEGTFLQFLLQTDFSLISTARLSFFQFLPQKELFSSFYRRTDFSPVSAAEGTFFHFLLQDWLFCYAAKLFCCAIKLPAV